MWRIGDRRSNNNPCNNQISQRGGLRYTHDWWIGRVVAAETTIGFIPTARRLARLTEQHEDEPEKSVDKNTMVAREAEIWEYPNPYTVVPSTRPIILLGPCYQSSRLTQLMHAAVRAREAEIWEYPNPYTVVPSTRPIILLGPCYQSSRLTQLMHAAVR
ncbi:hypothetical protein TELCIR_16784 [Teladorsagia circumcincta]|uniref:Uncharacterized protein n=1 Tax=Teladorsagia circumcincta TaxID=45464 RepID=A0A2G9TUT3_TELCI|nr:hypothetical protein TELCIR_16784 [Teladorsagia circumcincta]